MDELTLSIGDLARRTGVDIPTLRRWERYEGLLAPARTPGGQRRYGQRDVDAIEEVVGLVERGWPPSSAAKVVAGHRDTGAVVFDAELFDAVPVGVVITNADFEVLYANPHLAALLGADPDEVERAITLDLLDEPSRAALGQVFRDVRNGHETSSTFRARTRAGHVVDLEAVVGPLLGVAGRIRGAIGVVQPARDAGAASPDEALSVWSAVDSAGGEGPDPGFAGVIATISGALVRCDPLRTVLDTAVEGVARGLGADHVALAELVRATNETKVVAATGGSGVGTSVATGPFGSHLAFALQAHRPILVRDFAAERRFDRGPLAGEQAAVSGICVPVQWPGGEGALCVHSSTTHLAMTSEDITFVQTAANLCGLALERRADREGPARPTEDG